MDDLNCDFYQFNCLETQVMWRIFEAKPRTRLGRLSHARTHDDILDLVGDDDDDDDEDHLVRDDDDDEDDLVGDYDDDEDHLVCCDHER